jgi:spermidine synthase
LATPAPAATRRVPDPSAPRSGRELLLLALFFTSGATSLVYETLWARHLHLVFGTSQLAISAVLAAFMGGLAAGGFAAARWASNVRRPLLAYAVLEALIGAYALAFPRLQQVVAPVYVSFARSVEPGPVAAGAFQCLLAGILLLPPTLSMGATLPLLARSLTGERTRGVGSAIGRLYGANTLGAVLGTGLGGFVLLPALGLAVTTRWTAAANGLLAVVAALGSAAAAGEARDRVVAVPDRAGAIRDRARRAPASPARALPLLLLLAALTGFTGLLYEVTWFRLMSLMLGGSAYAFSIMLLAFLLGIGLGGWPGGAWADRAARRGGPARVLRGMAALQLGVAALSWGAMFAYGELPYAWVRLYDRAEGHGLLIWVGQLALALAIMTPPAILMGASFPCLAKAASDRLGAADRAVGLTYGANTLGAIGGAIGGSLFLLPALHVRGAVLVGVASNAGTAVLAAIAAARTSGGRFASRALGWTGAAAVAVAIAWHLRPPWDPLLMTSGMYKYVSELEERTRAGLAALAVEPYQLLFYDEGLSSVVTVAREKGRSNIWLANNGKIDASTEADLKTQVMVAHLPFAFRPQPEDVLVIGLASGITAGSVTLHPSPRRIDVVEIEPAIVEASHFFDLWNQLPLADPRVNLVIDDGRGFLLRADDGHYELVTSEPSNPWLAGVSSLFTREFFALGRRKLAPGGVWTQWLQTYEMAPDDLRSLLGTFADVYPEVAVYRVDDSDLVLVGSDRPLDVGAAAMRDRLWPVPAVAADLDRVDLERPEHVVAHYLFGRDEILRLAGDVELNTDDNMRIEYSAPRHLYDSTTEANRRLLLGASPLPQRAVEGAAGLVALASGYAELELWPRAVEALDAALRLEPDDRSIAELRAIYARESEVLGPVPP